MKRFVVLLTFFCLAAQALAAPAQDDDNDSVEEDNRNGMCPNHDPSIRGKFWNKIQEEVFENRFLDGADCDMGDPDGDLTWCDDDFLETATGLSSVLAERNRIKNEERKAERRKKYENHCSNRTLYESNNYKACCIRKNADGNYIGQLEEATLPCFHENKPRVCSEVDWEQRRKMICRIATSNQPLPICIMDSDCGEGQNCCWELDDDENLIVECRDMQTPEVGATL